MNAKIELLRKHVRDVPDFPKPGILFKDITPILTSPEAFCAAIELLRDHIRPMKPTGFVAIESRGFLFASPLALEFGVPLHIVRKPGKLPYKTESIEYSLEYGSGMLQIHQDSLRAGDRVVVLDDLLATGGTAAAAAKLAAKQGAEVLSCGFVIELAFLEGRKKIAPLPCFSLISY
jgi:adenine phosphoribosyltransferase